MTDYRMATYLRANAHTITNALRNHAEWQEISATAARKEWQRGLGDPAAKAEQDASLVTNHGYLLMAEMLEQDAAKARRVADEIDRLVEEDDE